MSGTPNPPIAGHHLLNEGGIFPIRDRGWDQKVIGHEGGCQCGEKPDGFPDLSKRQMKAWHREHKEELRGLPKPEPFVTYSMEDPTELVFGEYSYVTGTEWFDDRDGEVRLIKRTYKLVSEELLVLPDPYPIEDDDDDDDDVPSSPDGPSGGEEVREVRVP